MTELSERIVELREQGLTYDQIKAELNCSKGTISYHLGEGQKLKYAESSKKYRDRKYRKYYELKNHPCTDCKKKFPPYVMHWDHLGDKKANLALMICNSSWQAILDEIAKCELVCSNCHGLRTVARAIAEGTCSDLLAELYEEYMKDQQHSPLY